MQRFENILLALAAGSPGQGVALNRAAFVSKGHGAVLTVAGLVRPPCPDAAPTAAVSEDDNVSTAVVRACRETVEHLVEPFRADGIPIGTMVLCGTPFQEIIKQVLRGSHDLVMIVAEGDGGLKGAIFGSTSRHLIRKCPCPVWLLKRRERVPHRRVLASVSLDSDDRQQSALNRRILEIAVSIADQEDGEVHVAHAWSLPFEGVFRSRIPRRDLRKALRETRHTRRVELWRLVTPILSGRLDGVHLRKGGAETVIPALARQKEIDLVVVGADCRTGIAAFLIGNTVERVVERVDCSVLVIKPDGFVAPVRLEERDLLDGAA